MKKQANLSNKRLRKYSMVFMVVGMVFGTLLVSPASAHVNKSANHLWNKHIKPKVTALFYTKAQSDGRYLAGDAARAPGAINNPANPVDFSKLKNVPAGFADGVDDSGPGATIYTGQSPIQVNGTVISLSNAGCVPGEVWKYTLAGNFDCQPDNDSGGDITGVTAGAGLTGGGPTGNVTLGANIVPAGGDNGSATTLARGDHIHDARYFTEFESDGRYIRNQSASEQTGEMWINGTMRTGGMIRTGSETGAAGPGFFAGLVVRRVASTNPASGQVVARTDLLTLQRDGTVGGLRLSYAASPFRNQISCMGVNSVSASIPKYFEVPLNTAGTTGLYSSADDMVLIECQLGNTYNPQHNTSVELHRRSGDNYFVGHLVSSFNQ